MEKPTEHTEHRHLKHNKPDQSEKIGLYLMVAVAVLILFNQWQINSISSYVDKARGISGVATLGGGKDVSGVDINELKSTGHSVAALFPVEDIKTQEDAVRIMIPTGTPDYGAEMGVSFDDPIKSMESMAGAYPALKQQAQQNPQVWQRYINLASKPVGISCEFCCGLGPIGIDKNGNLGCGCQHLPALHTVTLWLMLNTEYSDADILREVMRWKTLFFPKNMVELALTVAGGDTSKLKDLPGMVGGC